MIKILASELVVTVYSYRGEPVVTYLKDCNVKRATTEVVD